MFRGLLAAFPDGSLRYINHAEKMSVFEKAPPDIEVKIKRLLAVSQPVVNQIGPWEQARLSPPAKGVIRMTFLVSDGLYLGQGPFHQMQEDPMAGPVIAASLDLLQAVADKTTGQQEMPDK